MAIVDKLLYNTIDAKSLTYGQSSVTGSKFIFGIYPCQIKSFFISVAIHPRSVM